MLYHMHLKKYLENQIEEMKKYKWVRGQELGRDQGENAFKEWAQKYASQYRKEYEEKESKQKYWNESIIRSGNEFYIRKELDEIVKNYEK